MQCFSMLIFSSTSILMFRNKEYVNDAVKPVQERQSIYLRCSLYLSLKIAKSSGLLPSSAQHCFPPLILGRENFLITRRPIQWGFCEGAWGGCCNYLRFAVLPDCETCLVIERFRSSIYSFHGAWIFWKVVVLSSRVVYFSLRHVVNDLQQMIQRPCLTDCIPTATK